MDVELRDETLVISLEPGSPHLAAVKALPIRFYSSGEWHVPWVRENYEAIQRLPIPLNGREPPEQTFSQVGVYHKALVLRLPYTIENSRLSRDLPDRALWKPDHGRWGGWIVAATARNMRFILSRWPDIPWTKAARERRDDLLGPVAEQREGQGEVQEEEPVLVRDYKFGGKWEPFEHQRKAFALSSSSEAFALLMEQRTGKTRVVIDTACYLYTRGEINGVLVVAPNSVKSTWEEQVFEHSPSYVEHDVVVYDSGNKKAEREEVDALVGGSRSSGRLKWLVVNVEALSYQGGRGLELSQLFVGRFEALMVIDESSRIKSPGAKRTKNAIKLGEEAAYRRILTGMPVTQGPLDLYSQFYFLDPDIISYGSYYSFRNHFAILAPRNWHGNRTTYEVVGYQNLEELQELVRPHSFRITRSECFDLPPKVYQKHFIRLSTEQWRLYSDLSEHMRAEFEGRVITTPIVLTQLLRLQQVVGGFLPPKPVDPLEEPLADEPEPVEIPGANPKLDLVLELVENELTGKVVIWARFRPEIDLLASRLREKFGEETVGEFHGGISTDERTQVRRRFQDPEDPLRFFVGQTETGGIGIRLDAASDVIYYSNSFSLESRVQSEDRTQGHEQEVSVGYHDLIAKDTLDEKLILPALREKKNLSDLITGDEWTRWI